MLEIIMTCPLTGCEVRAVKDEQNNVYVKHPLTDEIFKAKYICQSNEYVLPAQLFEHIETVTLSEAAEILGVTRQRVSTIANSGVIKPKIINNQTIFVRDEVLEYKRTRKVGAPRKAV